MILSGFRFHFFRAAAFLMGAFLFASPVLAQQVPSNLQVVGTIAAGNSVTPAVNDVVQVVLASNKSVRAQGTVLTSDNGTFFVDMSESQSFNGTQLTMLLKRSSGTYQLNNGSTPVTFAYSGTFPFPSRISFALTVGTLVTGGSTPGGDDNGGDGTANETYDVNGDGIFNQADIDAIKGALGQRNPDAKYDVNKDGVINTRDPIDAIRAFNSARTGQRMKSSTSTTTTTTP